MSKLEPDLAYHSIDFIDRARTYHAVLLGIVAWVSLLPLFVTLRLLMQHDVGLADLPKCRTQVHLESTLDSDEGIIPCSTIRLLESGRRHYHILLPICHAGPMSIPLATELRVSHAHPNDL